MIRSIVKNKLLSNSGALIKRLQKDAVDACGTNVMVYIDKEDKDDKKSSLTTLIVKSPRSLIELASTHVEHAIQKYGTAGFKGVFFPLLFVRDDKDRNPLYVALTGSYRDLFILYSNHLSTFIDKIDRNLFEYHNEKTKSSASDDLPF